MATATQFCGLLLLPERKDAVTRIQLTIGNIRKRFGHDCAEIAKQLKQDDGKPPHPDTISRAERGETMPSFDLLAQIAYIYGDCADPLRSLLAPAPTAEPTSLEDRLARAESEILAVRRELANRAA